MLRRAFLQDEKGLSLGEGVQNTAGLEEAGSRALESQCRLRIVTARENDALNEGKREGRARRRVEKKKETAPGARQGGPYASNDSYQEVMLDSWGIIGQLKKNRKKGTKAFDYPFARGCTPRLKPRIPLQGTARRCKTTNPEGGPKTRGKIHRAGKKSRVRSHRKRGEGPKSPRQVTD